MPSQTFNNQLAADLAAGRITYEQAIDELSKAMFEDGTSRSAGLAEANAPAYLNSMLVDQVTSLIQGENFVDAQSFIDKLGSLGIFDANRVNVLTSQVAAAKDIPAGQEEEIGAGAGTSDAVLPGGYVPVAATPPTAAVPPPPAAGVGTTDATGVGTTDATGVDPYQDIPAGQEEEIADAILGANLAPVGAVGTVDTSGTAIGEGALQLTPQDIASSLYETEPQRRRLFESLMPAGTASGIRRFLQRRFDPLNAQFMLSQALQPGPLAEEPGIPLNFLDFIKRPSQGAGLGTDVRNLIEAMRGGPGTGSEAQNLFYKGVEEAGPIRDLGKFIGYQHRLGSVPNILQSLVTSRLPFRAVEDQLREALTGTQKGFERFATVGPAANISDLLKDIHGRHGSGDITAYQRLMDQLGPTITGEEGQQGAFKIALQSRLQGAPLALRSSIEQLARQDFDRWLVKNPNTAFLPHYLRDRSFSPIVPELVT